MVDGKVTADTYLVLIPDIRTYGTSTYVYGVRVKHARASKPSLQKGEIAVRVKLNFYKQQLIDAIPVVEADVTNFVVAQEAPEIRIETGEVN